MYFSFAVLLAVVFAVDAHYSEKPNYTSSTIIPLHSSLSKTHTITISECPPSVPHCPYSTEPFTTTTIIEQSSDWFPESHPSTYPPLPTYYGSPSPTPEAPYPTSSPISTFQGPHYNVSIVTISTCVPTVITSVITMYPSDTAVRTPASYTPKLQVYPTAIFPPPSAGTAPPSSEFTGAGCVKKASGFLMVAGLLVALV